MNLYAFVIPLVLLLATGLLTMVLAALRKLGPIRSKRMFRTFPKTFFLYRLLRKIHRKFDWNELFFVLNFAKNTLLLAFAITGCFFFLTEVFGADTLSETPLALLILSAGITMLIALIVDALTRLISVVWPGAALQTAFFPSSLINLILLPITSILLVLLKSIFPSQEPKEGISAPRLAQDKIMELIHDHDLSSYLEPMQRKLLTSIATFQERIAREIMVPRIDVATLDIKATIKEASDLFQQEQYSRIPVYQDNVDQICGVLRYKDIIELYMNNAEKNGDFLNTPIESLIKPCLYAPETKKISKLLQEFRKEQNHMAVIVDEYGGTEGIVTIEDILEELVGEIEDEYDTEDETLFKPHESGEWIVDAKMSINDIEKELGVNIPHSPEYDTIGGYIFHRAGTIPAKGWRIHHENFELEILSSTERTIDKIRIIPLSAPKPVE